MEPLLLAICGTILLIVVFMAYGLDEPPKSNARNKKLTKKYMEKLFSTVCYLVLVNHHGKGFIEADPSYITEKAYIQSSSPEVAYAALDRENQMRVLDYCEKWKVELPEVIKKYEDDRIYNELD
jgi:hypothetical protein